MRTVKLPEEMREACDASRALGRGVGLVPTMGALHVGHLSLVRMAKTRAPFVCVTIFVNPTQFGPNEDFSRYPRDLEGDLRKLEGAGADLVFAPEPGAIYPAGEETRVRVGKTAAPLCGVFRPVHFEGVTTVVAKLFALAGPSVAVFGKKDYQQLQVIRRMTSDLFLPVEVVGHPIVREEDGLALSSRNAYLSTGERKRALSLSRGLSAAWKEFASGQRDAAALRAAVEKCIDADSTDYVEVVDAVDLASIETVKDRALVAVACRIGKTRLIDNVVLGEDPIPVP
jgi:pantoate--beta-alanine ligase